MLEFYVHNNNVFKLIEKYRPRRLNRVLSKYSKRSKSVKEIEDQEKELSKYLQFSRLVARIEDQNKLFTSKKE